MSRCIDLAKVWGIDPKKNEEDFGLLNSCEIILEELTKMDKHLTVNEVHEAVRLRIPTIRLPEVNCNLELLVDRGVVSRVHLANDVVRYEVVTKKHGHTLCTYCGEIKNINLPEYKCKNDFFLITGCKFEFMGVCESCQKEQAQHSVDSTLKCNFCEMV